MVKGCASSIQYQTLVTAVTAASHSRSVVQYRVSASLSFRLQNAIGLQFSSCFCSRTAPTPTLEASDMTRVSRPYSHRARTGALATSCWICSIAEAASSDHTNLRLQDTRSKRGAAMEAKCGIKDLYHTASPMKDRTSAADRKGVGHLSKDETLSGWVLMPPCDSLCPRNSTSCWRNSHFSRRAW